MALEAEEHPQQPLPFDYGAIDIQELRLSVIGNAEVKLLLRNHPQFLHWLQQQLERAHDRLAASSEMSDEGICGMHDLTVIMWLLYLVDRPSGEPEETQQLGECVAILAKTIDHFLGKGSKSFYEYMQAPESPAARALKDTVSYTLYVMLSFENSLNSLSNYVSVKRLWWFVNELVSGAQQTSACEPCMVAGLRLIPFLLDHGLRAQDASAKNDVVAMLNTVFAGLRAGLDCSSFPCTDNEEDISGIANDEGREALNSKKVKHILESELNMAATTALLVAAAQVLSFLETKADYGPAALAKIYTYKNRSLFTALFSLYGPGNTDLLNISLLNISRVYLSRLAKEKLSDEATINATFEYLFPRISWILKNNRVYSDSLPKYIRRPIAVLSDLCLSYPEVCLRIKNSNTDLRVLSYLKLLFSSSAGFKYLFDLKLQSAGGKDLVDFTSSNNTLQTSYVGAEDTQMDSIADHVLLLSVYTSSSEELRRRVTDYEIKAATPSFLCFLVCEVVENYQFLSLQLLLNLAFFRELQKLPQNTPESEQKWRWFSQNLGHLLFLFEHPVYTNTFYLLRSLSRGVTNQKTFYVDCNSIRSTYDHFSGSTHRAAAEKASQNFLALVSQKYDLSSHLGSYEAFLSSLLSFVISHKAISYALSFFCLAKDGNDALVENVRKSFASLTTLVLACLANFCLDFSTFRKLILQNERFLKALSRMFNRSLRRKNDHIREGNRPLVENLWHEILYEQLQIQIGIFQIVQNLLYNETEENRRAVWAHIPLTVVFEKSLYGVSVLRSSDPELHELLLKLKVISFAIMRNLTLSSTFFCRSISHIYLKYVLWQEEPRYLVPPTWNEYLLENLLAHDLFLDVERCGSVDEAVGKDDAYYLNLLQVPEYHGLFVAISFLEDNRHINTPDFTQSDFPSDGLLKYWKRILQVRMLHEYEAKHAGTENDINNFSVKLVDAKFAIVWNLINILYEEEDHRRAHNNGGVFPGRRSSSSMDVVADPVRDVAMTEEGQEVYMTVQEKAHRLLEFGFKEVLADVITQMSIPWKKYLNSGKFGLLPRFENANSNDFLQKAKTAYQQILAAGNGISPDQVVMKFEGADDKLTTGMLDSIILYHSAEASCEHLGRPNEDPFRSDDENENDNDDNDEEDEETWLR